MDDIQSALQALTLSSPSQTSNSTTSTAISTLAEASKTNLSVRESLASSTILAKLIETIECSIHDDLDITSLALRCIGNACIDNNEARQNVVTHGTTWLKQCILAGQDEALRLLATKVLYNVCSDYQPAQQKCYEDHFHYDLFDLWLLNRRQPLANGEATMLVDVLFWITCMKPQDQNVTMPADVLFNLLRLPVAGSNEPDDEDVATLLEICLTFVRDPSIQAQIVEAGHVSCVWCMLVESEGRVVNRDTEDLFRPISTSLIWCLSDLSAHEDFRRMPGLMELFANGLVQDIKEAGRESSRRMHNETSSEMEVDTVQYPDRQFGDLTPRIVTAACQVLGNLLWAVDADSVIPFVVREELHKSAWQIICAAPKDEELLHATSGMLLHLTKSSIEVREEIGADQNAEPGLTLLCHHSTVALKQDGVKLLRALGKECRVNQERFASLAGRILSTGNDRESEGVVPE